MKQNKPSEEVNVTKIRENPSEELTKTSIPDLVKKWAPLVGFLGGVGWDSWTLGRIVKIEDLWILGAYLMLGLCSTLLFNRNWEKWGIFAYHFCVGTLLSALVILYAKSAASFGSFSLVIGVGFILVFNEFWGENKLDQFFRNILLWLVCTMYFQFVFPHVFESVSSGWFFLALVASNSLIYFFAKLQKTHVVKPILALSALWVILWFINIFPPIPLVLKDQFVGFELDRKNYSSKLLSEDQLFGVPKVELPKGEKLVYLSSVFAPKGVSADLEHRWIFIGSDGKEKLVDRIPLKLRSGGREKGWRFYSWKQNLSEGKWFLETAVEDGPVISRTKLNLSFVNEQKGNFESRQLN